MRSVFFIVVCFNIIAASYCDNFYYVQKKLHPTRLDSKKVLFIRGVITHTQTDSCPEIVLLRNHPSLEWESVQSMEEQEEMRVNRSRSPYVRSSVKCPPTRYYLYWKESPYAGVPLSFINDNLNRNDYNYGAHDTSDSLVGYEVILITDKWHTKIVNGRKEVVLYRKNCYVEIMEKEISPLLNVISPASTSISFNPTIAYFQFLFLLDKEKDPKLRKGILLEMIATGVFKDSRNNLRAVLNDNFSELSQREKERIIRRNKRKR